MPIELERQVERLWIEDGDYHLATDSGTYLADQVVVATGPFQRPFVPELSHRLDESVHQLHSAHYRNPGGLPEGNVLVVGAGNSGWQIAEELARERKTFLSQGTVLPRVPRRILGRSLFAWLESLGITRVPASSRIGKRMRANDDVVIGPLPRDLLRSGQLELLGRAETAKGNRVHFADGRSLSVAAVIWATGYRPDFSWIDVPVFTDNGEPLQDRGVTGSSGLYFVGLRWLHTTGSALLGWVGRDASYIAEQVEQRAWR